MLQAAPAGCGGAGTRLQLLSRRSEELNIVDICPDGNRQPEGHTHRALAAPVHQHFAAHSRPLFHVNVHVSFLRRAPVFTRRLQEIRRFCNWPHVEHDFAGKRGKIGTCPGCAEKGGQWSRGLAPAAVAEALAF